MKRNIFEKTIERRKFLTDSVGASQEVTVNWTASSRVPDQPTVIETGSKLGMAIRDRIILSVTDDMEFDKRLRMAAVARGQVIIRVDSMEAALRTVRTGCCGVALLDLDLAGQLAWKTADGLLQDSKCPPVVLLTGPSEQLDLRAAVQAGSIVDKSTETSLILNAVKKILEAPLALRVGMNAAQRAIVRWLSPCTWPISGASPQRFWASTNNINTTRTIMKKNKNPKVNGNGKVIQSIHIEFSHPTAEVVAIAGTFNDWKPETTRMIAVGEGHWRKELVLPPGAHEYLLVADGEWVPDPSAPETVANPFGGVNSVVRVEAKGELRSSAQGVTIQRHFETVKK